MIDDGPTNGTHRMTHGWTKTSQNKCVLLLHTSVSTQIHTTQISQNHEKSFQFAKLTPPHLSKFNLFSISVQILIIRLVLIMSVAAMGIVSGGIGYLSQLFTSDIAASTHQFCCFSVNSSPLHMNFSRSGCLVKRGSLLSPRVSVSTTGNAKIDGVDDQLSLSPDEIKPARVRPFIRICIVNILQICNLKILSFWSWDFGIWSCVLTCISLEKSLKFEVLWWKVPRILKIFEDQIFDQISWPNRYLNIYFFESYSQNLWSNASLSLYRLPILLVAWVLIFLKGQSLINAIVFSIMMLSWRTSFHHLSGWLSMVYFVNKYIKWIKRMQKSGRHSWMDKIDGLGLRLN